MSETKTSSLPCSLWDPSCMEHDKTAMNKSWTVYSVNHKDIVVFKPVKKQVTLKENNQVLSYTQFDLGIIDGTTKSDNKRVIPFIVANDDSGSEVLFDHFSYGLSKGVKNKKANSGGAPPVKTATDEEYQLSLVTKDIIPSGKQEQWSLALKKMIEDITTTLIYGYPDTRDIWAEAPEAAIATVSRELMPVWLNKDKEGNRTGKETIYLKLKNIRLNGGGFDYTPTQIYEYVENDEGKVPWAHRKVQDLEGTHCHVTTTMWFMNIFLGNKASLRRRCTQIFYKPVKEVEQVPMFGRAIDFESDEPPPVTPQLTTQPQILSNPVDEEKHDFDDDDLDSLPTSG